MATQYGSSIEALDDLLTTNHVTDISTSLSYLTNGMEYSFVEVTCSDGIQYGLQAYGIEALELNRLAADNIPKSDNW
jgi:hypothetical protein